MTKMEDVIMSGLSNWDASQEQKTRIAAFEQWLLGFFSDYEARKFDEEGDLWSFSRRIRDQEPDVPLFPGLEAFFNNPFGNAFEQYVADFYFHPMAVQGIPNERHNHDTTWNYRVRAAERLCEFVLQRSGSQYSFEQAIGRLTYQLHHPESVMEMVIPTWKMAELEKELAGLSPEQAEQKRKEIDEPGNFYDHPFLSPSPADTAKIALELARDTSQAEMVLKLLFNPVRILDATFKPAPNVKNYNDCPITKSSGQYLDIGRRAESLFKRLKQLSLATEENIVQLLELESMGHCYLLNAILTYEEPEYQEFKKTALDWLYSITLLPVEEALTRLARIADQKSTDVHLSGGRFLLAAARLMDAQGKSVPISREGVDKAYLMLCHLAALDTHETREEMISSLQAFSPSIQSKVFGSARKYNDLLVISLGLDNTLPLFNWLKKREYADVNDCFNVSEANELLAQAGEQTQPLLKLIKASGRYKQSLKRLETVQGIADPKMQSQLLRYSQEHIRLYGLLPIKDADDLANRYRYFKAAGKEASKMFGNERTGNVRDAAQAGLLNLAVRAGFHDLAEMEWAIDARSGEAFQMELEFEDYALSIAIKKHKPEMTISKNGKLLKSVPPALKKSEPLKPLLATFEVLKDQAKRYRESIENLMVQGRWLEPQQLQEIVQLPIARSMLGVLVLRMDNGLAGVPAVDFKSLVTLDNSEIPLNKPIQVAHAMQLLDDGVLADWQQAVVNRGICQPFKQVFRECYVVTPAELVAVNESSRFAGRRVRTRVLGATLTGRGWRVEGSEGSCVVSKRVAKNLIGVLELPDVYHFLTEEETTVLDTISFSEGSTKISLAEVPAVAFSEFMRDLDLVITVGAADSEETSIEVQKNRVALVSSLLPSLGLSNVAIDGHHVVIEGKRATYRLHLGTAVIHIMPGSYLCIVPESSTPRTSVALPFVDEDARTSEVLSKIFMLSADHKIKDTSILDQIERNKTQ
jgi:hypothetical protein